MDWLFHKEAIKSCRQKVKIMHITQKTLGRNQFQINIMKEKHLNMK